MLALQPQQAPCCAPLALLVVSDVADLSDSRTSVVGLAALRAPVLGLHIVFRHARLAEPLADRLAPAATSARTTRSSIALHPLPRRSLCSPSRTLRTRIKKAKLRNLRSARCSSLSQSASATSASHSLT